MVDNKNVFSILSSRIHEMDVITYIFKDCQYWSGTCMRDLISVYTTLQDLYSYSGIVVNTDIVTAGNLEPQWKCEVWRFKIWFNPPFL